MSDDILQDILDSVLEDDRLTTDTLVAGVLVAAAIIHVGKGLIKCLEETKGVHEGNRG